MKAEDPNRSTCDVASDCGGGKNCTRRGDESSGPNEEGQPENDPARALQKKEHADSWEKAISSRVEVEVDARSREQRANPYKAKHERVRGLQIQLHVSDSEPTRIRMTEDLRQRDVGRNTSRWPRDGFS